MVAGYRRFRGRPSVIVRVRQLVRTPGRPI